MEASLIPQTLGGWLATLSTFILGILMWRVQANKGRVDESAVVLSEWKKLLETHQSQISAMAAEIADLRVRLVKAEERIRELQIENDGLRRALLQNGQSTVLALHRSRKRGDTQDHRLDNLKEPK